MMNIGRPPSFQREDARQRLLTHLWQHGYQGSASRDLQAASGLSASSLYRTFGNKESLFIECLNTYTTELLQQLSGQLESARGARAFIDGLFTFTASQADSPAAHLGCMIVNSAAELGASDGPCAERARHCLNQLTQFFCQALTQAQKEGDLSTETDPALQASLLVTLMIGLRTQLKAGLPRDQAVSLANNLVSSVFPNTRATRRA